VYLSSLAAAGPASDGAVGPGDPPRPITAYGRSKLAGEQACLEAPGIEAVVLRPPAVYGPGDRDLLTFYRLAERGLLPVVGSRDRRLQLIHASDLADAIVQASTATGVTGIFHVAESTAYTWDRVLDLMADAVGVNGRRIRIPATMLRAAAALSELAARVTRRPAIFDRDKAREILAPGWLCETDRARTELGFVARTPLGDGLRETAEWYRTYGWL
jgi:dihydroflavonol-4-reductase